MPHFLGKWGGKLFMGEGIEVEDLRLVNFWYLVPIPQNATFSVEEHNIAVPGTFSTKCYIFWEIEKLFVYGKGNKNSGC
jgi:hypothetical protein